MTFVSIHDIRTRPSEVWQQLHNEGDLISYTKKRRTPHGLPIVDA